MPFSQDDSFIGREDSIAQINERRTAAPSHTRTALVGIGGVGSVLIYICFVDDTINKLPESRKSRLSMHIEPAKRHQRCS
jgi:hypothetical protein